MCVCRHVLYVSNAHHMFQESPLGMMCDWKIQDVMLTFSGFFHYVSSMHVNNPNLACDFQFYVQRFLRFGLAMMSYYLWFGT